MSEKSCAGLGFLVAMIAILFLFLVAGQRDALKQEAVEHGYAEWIVTGQNKTGFKWKQNEYTAPNLSNK